MNLTLKNILKKKTNLFLKLSIPPAQPEPPVRGCLSSPVGDPVARPHGLYHSHLPRPSTGDYYQGSEKSVMTKFYSKNPTPKF